MYHRNRIFCIDYDITRAPDNPIIGGVDRIGETAMIFEVLQTAFMILIGFFCTPKIFKTR